MSLSYSEIVFSIHFQKPFAFSTLPSIIFRSILGSRLRLITCINRKAVCKNCQFNNTCAYAVIFETIIDKNTSYLPGRDRGSHPFRFKVDPDFQLKMPCSDIQLTIQLYGFAIQYLPYIFYALQQAGRDGLFKEKAVYAITNVTAGAQSILQSQNDIRTQFEHSVWEPKKVETEKSVQYAVLLLSPLRFKVKGSYNLHFSAGNFLQAIDRRLVTLCSLYGNFSEKNSYIPTKELKIIEKNISWVDYFYHSHRQKKIIQLGGVTGCFILDDISTEYEKNLLAFADAFGVGKNTNFGLGNLAVQPMMRN